MAETLFAPAKLTLSLLVTGVRDDGLHEIEAEMVSLDFGDMLTFAASSEADVSLVGRYASGLSSGADNLVVRALSAVGRSAAVLVEKNIPTGAGLGGGSADAAAVLRWAGGCDTATAASLGADVPFCMMGGRARVTGIGEQVQPLPFVEATFTLWTPPIHVPTAAVYRQWDLLGGPVGEASNDLEPAALALFPELLSARDRFADATGQRPRLAGSGSTWFVAGEHPGRDFVVARTVPAHGPGPRDEGLA